MRGRGKILTTRLRRGIGRLRAPNLDGHLVVQEALKPERPFLAVGDVHGCDTALAVLLQRIARHRVEEPGFDAAALVLLGDMVDRGPDSRAVLTRVLEMTATAPGEVVCLAGNHELMLVDFIDDPLGRGARWLAFGGAETLSSFDIRPVTEKSGAEAIMAAADQLEQALTTEGLLGWLRNLPDRWSSGNLACVHAGMAPGIPLNRQEQRDLCWGQSMFSRQPRTDGLWVVHGHTIMQRPTCAEGRIALDTGAYRGGRLTAAALRPGQCRFLQV